MALINNSPWCATWKDKLKSYMGYEVMKEIFIQMEWTVGKRFQKHQFLSPVVQI